MTRSRLSGPQICVSQWSPEKQNQWETCREVMSVCVYICVHAEEVLYLKHLIHRIPEAGLPDMHRTGRKAGLSQSHGSSGGFPCPPQVASTVPGATEALSHTH